MLHVIKDLRVMETKIHALFIYKTPIGYVFRKL
jgi:hypothetical protein